MHIIQGIHYIVVIFENVRPSFKKNDIHVSFKISDDLYVQRLSYFFNFYQHLSNHELPSKLCCLNLLFSIIFNSMVFLEDHNDMLLQLRPIQPGEIPTFSVLISVKIILH